MRKGTFEVVNSFAIRSREEGYLIGRVTEGQVQVGWSITVPINDSVEFSFKITAIEEIEVTSYNEVDTLLVLGAKEGSEYEWELMMIVGPQLDFLKIEDLN